MNLDKIGKIYCAIFSASLLSSVDSIVRSYSACKWYIPETKHCIPITFWFVQKLSTGMELLINSFGHLFPDDFGLLFSSGSFSNHSAKDLYYRYNSISRMVFEIYSRDNISDDSHLLVSQIWIHQVYLRIFNFIYFIHV